jgi:hypothetical protein
MDKDQQLREQDAPLKNTDRAFVKVGDDGAPQFPEGEDAQTQHSSAQEGERTTDLDKR